MLVCGSNENLNDSSDEISNPLFSSQQNQISSNPDESYIKYIHDSQTGDDRIILNLDTLSKTLVPRDYQKEALEKILNSNSILVLETGTGKTLVAQMLIEYTFQQYNFLSSTEAKGSLHKKVKRPILFLCNTSFLVEQQGAFLKENSDRSIKTYASSGPQSKYRKQQWDHIWDTYEVHVMTGQLFLNILRGGFLEFNRILLIIFDECHHSRKDEPYSRIMKEFYYHANKEERPQIFGMTASTSNATEKIETSINRIEAYLDSSLVSVDLSFYNIVSSPPVYDYVVQSFKEYKWFLEIIETIDFILNELGVYPCNKLFFNLLIYLKKAIEPLVIKSENTFISKSDIFSFDYGLADTEKFGLESISKIIEVYNNLSTLPEFIHTIESLKDISNLSSNIWTSHIKSFDLSSATKFPEKKRKLKSLTKYHDIKSSLAPKVSTLLDYLLENKNEFLHNEKNPNSQFRAIIFVHRRSAVYSIAYLLDELEEFDFIRCEPFHGTNSKSNLVLNAFCYSKTLKTKISATDQSDTLSKFKSGILNVLVSTQVSEEGLDISDCNLIIRFDPALTLIQFIQSRGRARKSESEYVMMVLDSQQNKDIDSFYPYISHAKSVRDFSVHRNSDFYKKFMAMEEIMLKFCIAPKEVRYNNYGLNFLADKQSLITGKLTFSINVDDLNFEGVSTNHLEFVESSVLIQDSIKETLDKLTCELFCALRKVSISEVFFDVIQSGAKLTALSSISTLFQYTQSLPSDKYSVNSPIFEYDTFSKSEIRATITFPANSPIKKIIGPFSVSKNLSKRAACFYSVLVLFHYGLLTNHLLPIQPKKLTTADLSSGSVLQINFQDITDIVNCENILASYGPNYNKNSNTAVFPIQQNDVIPPAPEFNETENHVDYLHFQPSTLYQEKTLNTHPLSLDDLETHNFIDVYAYSLNLDYPNYSKSNSSSFVDLSLSDQVIDNSDSKGLQVIFFFRNVLPPNILIPLYTLKDSLPFYYSFEPLNASQENQEKHSGFTSPKVADNPANIPNLDNKISLSLVDWESSILFTSSLISLLTNTPFHLDSKVAAYSIAIPSDELSQNLSEIYKKIDLYSLTSSVFSQESSKEPKNTDPNKEFKIGNDGIVIGTESINWNSMNKFSQIPDRLSNYPKEKYSEILNKYAFVSETAKYKVHKFISTIDACTAYSPLVESLLCVKNMKLESRNVSCDNQPEVSFFDSVDTSSNIPEAQKFYSSISGLSDELIFLMSESDRLGNLRYIDLLLQDSRIYSDYDYKNFKNYPLIFSKEISLQINFLNCSSTVLDITPDFKAVASNLELANKYEDLINKISAESNNKKLNRLKNLVGYITKFLCTPNMMIILPWSIDELYKLSVIPSLLERLDSTLIQRDMVSALNLPIVYDDNNINFFGLKGESRELKILKKNLKLYNVVDSNISSSPDSDSTNASSNDGLSYENFKNRLDFKLISTASLTKKKNKFQKYVENYACYNSMPEWLLRSALTSPTASEDVNYQRLETLGDSALRLIMATQLFCGLAPISSHEGILTSYIGTIVSNQTLSKLSIKSGLFFAIKSFKLERKSFSPCGLGWGTSKNVYPRFNCYYETPWGYHNKIPNSDNLPLEDSLISPIQSESLEYFKKFNAKAEFCEAFDNFKSCSSKGILSAINVKEGTLDFDKNEFQKYEFCNCFFYKIYSFVPYPQRFLYYSHKKGTETDFTEPSGSLDVSSYFNIYGIKAAIDGRANNEIKFKNLQSRLDFLQKYNYIKDNCISCSPDNTDSANLAIINQDQNELKDLLPKPSFFFYNPSTSINSTNFQTCNNHLPMFAKIIKVNRKKREIPKKTAADVLESVLGASFLLVGIKGCFLTAKALGLVKKEWSQWDDMYSAYQKSLNEEVYFSSENMYFFEDTYIKSKINSIEGILEYKFKNPIFLIEATTHSSASNSRFLSYERLEFLGDSILSILVTFHFYNYLEHNEPLTSQQITLLKHVAVSNDVLGIISQRHNLIQHLTFNSDYLRKDISKYSNDLENIVKIYKDFKNSEQSSKGDANMLSCLSNNLNNNNPESFDWLDIPPKLWKILDPAPKSIGDLVESLLGAVYVDSGFSLDSVQNVFNKLLLPFIDKFIGPHQVTIDSVSHSNLTIQSHGCNGFKIVSLRIEDAFRDEMYNDTIIPIILREHMVNYCDYSLLNPEFTANKGFKRKELSSLQYSEDTKKRLEALVLNEFNVTKFDKKLCINSMISASEDQLNELLKKYCNFSISYYTLHENTIIGTGIGVKAKLANINACNNFLHNWEFSPDNVTKRLFNTFCDCESKREAILE
ncbi:Dicer-like protein 1 [Smittium culicis]|uniref:Dicer-like protein 1 n=1 Tax=Smittium culicis TaxID=133412 RepID=A0A1R1YSW5_9FUNG|nr:Dicer-like protein 1 [Smittium culicis]